MNLDNLNIPMVISGDFNSAPFSSALHIMNNKPFDPEDQQDPRYKTPAYEDNFGLEQFREIDDRYQEVKSELENVEGKVKSSYQFYCNSVNNKEQENEYVIKNVADDENWASWNEKSHPECTCNFRGK